MDESLKRQIYEECRIRNRSEGTCKQYTYHIGKFLDWVGEVCKLAPTDIYMSSMQIHVRNSKNHGDHWTILSERALELLKQYWYRASPVTP